MSSSPRAAGCTQRVGVVRPMLMTMSSMLVKLPATAMGWPYSGSTTMPPMNSLNRC